MNDSASPSRTRLGLVLGAFVVSTLAAAAAGGLFMPGAWYAGLQKPSWNPPSWIFGPVWSVLYVAIAAAGFLAWRGAGPKRRRIVVVAWAGQMILNAAWSAIFFGLHRPGLALAEILLLFFAIVACMAVFASVSRAAALLFVPYAAWVAFAGALNAAIWHLNR